MPKLGEVYRWCRCRSTDRLQAGMPPASSNKPPHRQPTPPPTCSHYTPLHGPNGQMVFRAGVGRTDTAKRSPEQGGDVACSDHTQELVWRHLNVFERECELRCRLPRQRWQTPDTSHPLKTAKSNKKSALRTAPQRSIARLETLGDPEEVDTPFSRRVSRRS